VNRAKTQKECLALWLVLLQTVDEKLDPNFDPSDMPVMRVVPPPIPGGGAPPPGADPSVIPDPKLRAEYQKAILANREKANDYRLQTRLRALNERITLRAESFLRENFAGEVAARKEANEAIENTIKNAHRKKRLQEILTP
jgi:hypothetical protein